LDRCLPNTAIATLEAMRLLLFTPRTAFIIAADERLIRNSVRQHFNSATLDDELVTSYFDKLIQVPLRAPRLGAAEVKGYVALLFAELAVRQGTLTPARYSDIRDRILDSTRKSWGAGLNRATVAAAFGADSTRFAAQIDLADQVAVLMASADRIGG